MATSTSALTSTPFLSSKVRTHCHSSLLLFKRSAKLACFCSIIISVVRDYIYYCFYTWLNPVSNPSIVLFAFSEGFGPRRSLFVVAVFVSEMREKRIEENMFGRGTTAIGTQAQRHWLGWVSSVFSLAFIL